MFIMDVLNVNCGCQFERYLDFCLVLNVKLNISTKFVLQYISLQVFQDAS